MPTLLTYRKRMHHSLPTHYPRDDLGGYSSFVEVEIEGSCQGPAFFATPCTPRRLRRQRKSMFRTTGQSQTRQLQGWHDAYLIECSSGNLSKADTSLLRPERIKFMHILSPVNVRSPTLRMWMCARVTQSFLMKPLHSNPGFPFASASGESVSLNAVDFGEGRGSGRGTCLTVITPH